MLRYKKHKRMTDGLGTSGVGIMDDTDLEVSSFTDRAFRSLCVAEEEPFNEVPRLPSPIRGMPLSTKYHLGIFNLSVRKTQPLAQIPTLPGQRGKWAPTFQPLLNCRREGLIDGKTNINKLCAPEPRGYKQRSKVSSLIKTFDNIENERPDASPLQTRLPYCKSSQSGKYNAQEPPCEITRKFDTKNELLEPTNQEDIEQNENYNLHRRTAREVFLETQADKCSMLSGSPCSLGSPLLDAPKKVGKEPSRKTSFLHSENSAFKSWSDLHKRIAGCDESDSSLPGTPPVLGSTAPCSPLLPRMIPGIRAKEAGMEIGLTSPSSTVSSSYDAVQMLKTVPPLPSKRTSKQNKESRHRTGAIRVPVDSRIHVEGMQEDVGSPSSKEHFSWTGIPTDIENSKSPLISMKESGKNQRTEIGSKTIQSPIKQNEEVQAIKVLPQLAGTIEVKDKGHNVMVPNEHVPSPGRIKTMVHQMEMDTAKVGSQRLSDKTHQLKNLTRDDTAGPIPPVIHAISPNSNTPTQSSNIVPPWRRVKVQKEQKLETEEQFHSTTLDKRESATDDPHETVSINKEAFTQEKPTMASFNITNLLTPVIRRKNIQEALEELPMMITPPPTEGLIIKEQDPREVSLYQNRDDYKSKATGLLFNLKDMRKRVKSTYNPATTVRNWKENSVLRESRIQEDTNIPVLNTNKLMTVRENASNINDIQSPRQSERESKLDLTGNTADNYLSLSSPQQIKDNSVFENGKTIPAEIHPDTTVPEEHSGSVRVHSLEQPIRKSKDYPSLNLYHKDDADPKAELTENNHFDTILVKAAEDPPLYTENITKEIDPNGSWGEAEDLSVICGNTVKLKDIEDVLHYPEHYHPSHEVERKISSENDEERREECKDELQYYALSSCVVEGRGHSGGLENDIEKKVEKKKPVASENQSQEIVFGEEHQRSASISSFKPNLFRIKDNKIKSCPVTKSVRLPLLRSLSEDSLFYRKGELNNILDSRTDLNETEQNVGEYKNINNSVINANNEKTEKYNKGKIRELLTMRPASETLKTECIDYSHVKKQREEADNLELWEKLCSLNAEWRKTEGNKTEISNLVKLENFDRSSPNLEAPFFHPVETCVSDVTGPSPECNTLLVQDVSDSIMHMVNGEVSGTPLLTAVSPLCSPLDSGLLQFEDAVSFSEGIPCSTITSPMLESVTCSMVASPMSVNTQSSGFTTALSALEDLPSPTLVGVNCKTVKYPVSSPEKTIPNLTESTETQLTDHSRLPQERASVVEPQKMNSGKPPAVPPKTEKALRRAKRLTKKRRKTELPQRIQDGEINEAEFVLDVPSPGNATPSLMIPPTRHKVISSLPSTVQEEGSISSSSTPSFPVTQRKLLQDPDSGQYFVVDIPVHFRVKTFYDPETGKYLQLSLPPSEAATPTLEVLNSPFMLYPGLPPVPVSTISSLKGTSAHVSLGKGETEEFWKDRDDEEDSLKGHQYIESACDSCDQSMRGTPQSMDRIQSRSRSPDIISIKDLDEFAMEAIS
ncbi:cardiac-enriched FHL2-interacting protein [Rhinophrynus dorsalis]